MGLRQAAPGWCFVRGEVTTEIFLKGLVELGIPGVEMIDQKYWSMANDLGLTIATHGGHASLTDGLNKPENHSRIEDELSKNIELAKEFGIVNLICFSGNNFTPITKIKIAQTNQVIIAVSPDIATAVFITVLAAIAPAIPSKIIINPAK